MNPANYEKSPSEHLPVMVCPVCGAGGQTGRSSACEECWNDRPWSARVRQIGEQFGKNNVQAIREELYELGYALRANGTMSRWTDTEGGRPTPEAFRATVAAAVKPTVDSLPSVASVDGKWQPMRITVDEHNLAKWLFLTDPAIAAELEARTLEADPQKLNPGPTRTKILRVMWGEDDRITNATHDTLTVTHGKPGTKAAFRREMEARALAIFQAVGASQEKPKAIGETAQAAQPNPPGGPARRQGPLGSNAPYSLSSDWFQPLSIPYFRSR